MNKDTALEIIRDEKLKYYNWCDDHNINPNEVCIRRLENKWIVFTSDERTTPISKREYESEYEALEDFIKRLRAMNKLKNFYKRR